jgi:hypothetical protein
MIPAMNTIPLLALFVVFTGTFVSLGAMIKARRPPAPDFTTQADRRQALRTELRLVR